MSNKWTTEEIQTFENLLVDGVEICAIQKEISRTQCAISKKARSYGYGTKTDTGAKVLYEDIKTRNRVQQPTQDDASDNLLSSIDSQTFEEVIEAIHQDNHVVNTNSLVVEMLSEYGVSITPEIIYTLSTYILNMQGSHNAN